MTDYSRDITAKNLLSRLGITENLNKPGVTELMINRPGEYFIETSEGVQYFKDEKLTLTVLMDLANVLTILNNKHITAKEPIHSVTLPDGERCHIIIPPACEPGTVVFGFRKPSKNRFTLSDYQNTGRLAGYEIAAGNRLNASDELHLYEKQLLQYMQNQELDKFFDLAIKEKLNICMVGGTGSGKTTFTKSIADLIPKSTRIITIEDTHELDLPNHPNRVHLFYKEHITAKSVIASCMRLKPDRIFLTELRGDEAWDYLSALNTGHPGGLTSVHANDAISVYYRIAQLAKESKAGQGMEYQYILNIVRSTIDIVCFFEKTKLKEIYYDPMAKRHALKGNT